MPVAAIDYFLIGELIGLSQASSSGRSDYILYTFRLIDAETGLEGWENFDEIKKEGLEDAAYR
jgi:PBP1b-binding outer membrane lipoprotein LpoB